MLRKKYRLHKFLPFNILPIAKIWNRDIIIILYRSGRLTWSDRKIDEEKVLELLAYSFRHLYDLDDFYSTDGGVRRCPICGCTSLMEKIESSFSEGEVLEFSIWCDDCKEYLGYWAHGAYDPYFRRNAIRYLLRDNIK